MIDLHKCSIEKSIQFVGFKIPAGQLAQLKAIHTVDVTKTRLMWPECTDGMIFTLVNSTTVELRLRAKSWRSRIGSVWVVEEENAYDRLTRQVGPGLAKEVTDLLMRVYDTINHQGN